MTNNELGFDYLRDNMSIYKEQLVLRDLDYCIIDEVDSVLIDEARTPQMCIRDRRERPWTDFHPTAYRMLMEKDSDTMKRYDLIIVGSGPAGLAAAIYAQRAKLDTLVVEKAMVSGGQVLTTYEVDNYQMCIRDRASSLASARVRALIPPLVAE